MTDDYRAALEGAAVFDMVGRTVIEAGGPDAAMFLHNLCTQDVKGLPLGETREAFLTTNKARVVAHVWITRRESHLFWLDMVAGMGDPVLTHLNRFLISEQVELADRTQSFGLLRIVGAIAADFVHKLGARPPLVQQHRLLGFDGFDLFCPTSEVALLRQFFIESGAAACSPKTYRVLRIEAGLPEYGIDIDENRLAMEVNRPQAISYNKGCYLGQETIVMARDRGQVNRLLMGVKAGAGEPFAAGAKVMRGNDEVGQITSSVFSPRLGQVIALAYMKRGSWDGGTEVAIEASTGVVSTLPFC